MRGAMDVFVMPSLHEGLPLVAIEAQAAGLPTILSDIVTNEVDIAEFLMRRLSISQSASEWADAILEIGKGLTMRERANAVDIIGELPFNIKNGIKDITLIYEEQAL
jgi:glycosyltransferase involved in cell wall biosynthesis